LLTGSPSRDVGRTITNNSGVVMQKCYAIYLDRGYHEGNGRGGIRTHGGFPHARFRVECLKPDSATLPIARYCPYYFATSNRQTAPEFAKAKHDTSVSMTRLAAFILHTPKRRCRHRGRRGPILLSAFAIKRQRFTAFAREARQTESSVGDRCSDLGAG
jgi:hypothetical protein